MDRRIIAVAGLLVGSMLASHVAAQNITTSSPPLKGMPAPSVADSNAWGTAPAQTSDWKSSAPIPGSPDRLTAPANVRLNLTPVSSTGALRRLPFYVTAPYWLPRSRVFGKANNDITTQQPPAAHGALINDIATLVHSASSD
jgi:hypothetical protein